MPPDRTDLYAVLGITPQATQEQIRRAYRMLMRQNHPDTRPQSDTAANAASNTTLQKAVAAYAILGDPGRRASYDQRTTRQQTITPHQTTPLRNLPRIPVPRHPLGQPPIQAGPVHWHPGPQ